jgi:hypothetical protein
LPNDGVLPTASIFTESSEEIFPAEWHFVTKLGPQVSPFPVPIFGVNNNTPPLDNYMPCVCLVKNSPKNPVEKREGEKSTSQASLMLHLLPR